MSDQGKTKDPTLGDRAYEWWLLTCAPDKGHRGTAAQLRRCAKTRDALTVPAAMSLARRLGAFKEDQKVDERWLTKTLGLAIILAHVRENVATHPMTVCGWKSFPGERKESDAGDDAPSLKGLRFKRLLKTEDGDDLMTAFIRLVKFLDGKTNIENLARSYLKWDDRTRQDWAVKYYAANINPSEAEPPLAQAESVS